MSHENKYIVQIHVKVRHTLRIRESHAAHIKMYLFVLTKSYPVCITEPDRFSSWVPSCVYPYSRKCSLEFSHLVGSLEREREEEKKVKGNIQEEIRNLKSPAECSGFHTRVLT